MSIERYKIEITPLEKDGVYSATTYEVTDFTIQSSEILQQVDDGDFDIGVFTFDDVKIRLLCDTGSIETNGRYWDVNSPSSIFKYRRDLARVVVTLLDNEGLEVEQFKGLIDDTLTIEDYNNGYVDITVMSMAGIFNKNSVLGGSVRDGVTVKEALKGLLDRPQITNYLNYSDANMNPALDVVIDIGQKLDNKSYKDALNDLMVIAGSVLIIDVDDNIIVRDRADNSNTPHEYYNAGDALGRNNIIRLASYNTGVQRAFNKYEIEDTFKQDFAQSNQWGLREKELSVEDYITNEDTRNLIIDYYLTNFAYPKQEFQLQLETREAKAVNLLDLCKVGYFPILKQNNTGQAFSFPDNMPSVLNKKVIADNIGFKVIAKQVNMDNYTTTLKLREIGIKAGDSII